ncbi:MAG: CoA-binding protein [Candidatus Hodarchaeota archaeon]
MMEQKEKIDFKVKDISFINNIKTMAVIGPSEKRNFFFLRNHQESFKGNLYAIHPSLKEIPDFPKANVYKSIKEIPEDIDFAFIAVPAKLVPKVIEECVDKKVKLVSIFSAEFSDSGTKEGIELEKALIKNSQDKVRILGPNGMGLFYPKLGISWRSRFPTNPGNIGFIAQSGGICNIAIYTAKEFGINFSKVFSFGNGADLDFVDLLYYLSNDPETNLILCYIEGIKEERGPDLRTVLSQNNKPIVVLKGGKSNKGKIAAKTHTASISGKNQIWESLFKQYNLIEVDSLEKLLNTARLIDFYGFHDINNVAVFSISGGYGVVLVDLIEHAGLNIPDFSPEIQSKLDEIFFIRGTSSKNPLDVAAQLTYSNSIKEIIGIALSDKKIDALIMDFPSWYFSYEFFITPEKDYEKNILEALSSAHKYNKPLIPIIQRANTPDEHTRISRLLAKKKVPVFGDPLEIIPLLTKISDYKKKLNKSKTK